MPIYKGEEMEPTPDVVRPHIMMNQFGGELIKAGVVTYAAGDAPPPHVHPNDEQWIYLLEGATRWRFSMMNWTSSGRAIWSISRGAFRTGYVCSVPSVASLPARARPARAG